MMLGATYEISVQTVGGALPAPGFVYLPRDPAEVEVEADGDFNGETLTLDASDDGALWAPALDGGGQPVALSAPGAVTVATLARFYRPTAPDGTGDLLLTLRMR